MKSVSGIYCIKNKINNKVYIGQSKHVNVRLNQHKNKLKSNKHKNTYLQYSFNKYNIDNFEFILLEECDEKYLSERETHYIKLNQSFKRNKGYNLTEDTSRHVYKTRKLIGIKNKEVLERGRQTMINNARKVYQYDLNGNFIKEWLSCKEISKFYKASIGNFNNYLNNFTTSKSLFKSMWRWSDNNTSNISKYKKGHISRNIDVYWYDEFYKSYTSAIEASKDLKFSKDSIRRVMIGEKKDYNGFTFKYKD